MNDRKDNPGRTSEHEGNFQTKESLTGSAHSTIDKVETNEMTLQQMHDSEED